MLLAREVVGGATAMLKVVGIVPPVYLGLEMITQGILTIAPAYTEERARATALNIITTYTAELEKQNAAAATAAAAVPPENVVQFRVPAEAKGLSE